ncbi:MAG: MATE family efflux transporter, partial [Lachnospiraceae bacterium]|nr:MATE family efflux transporter [Lachnospiraceae bacterium]
MRKDPLTPIRDGSDVTGREALRIITRLSVPAILAMLASVLMQYIDASMVGSLGANASAAIGLVSSTTWLIGWIVQAAGVGFTVLIAHAIGAGNEIKARAIVKGGLAFVMILCGFFTVLSVVLAPHLPRILGGEEAIYREA